MKKCKKCGKIKPLDKFPKNGKYIAHKCRRCVKAQERERKSIRVEAIRQALKEKKIELGCCVCGWNSFDVGLDWERYDISLGE